jgi:DNA gyrase subunit A
VENRQPVDEIRVIGRNTQGVRLIQLDQGDEVMDVARLVPEDDDAAVDAGALDDGVPDDGVPDEQPAGTEAEGES